MSDRNLSAEEVAVGKHLLEGRATMAYLQARIDNLPPDKGLNPQLTPDGGPANTSNAQLRLTLEKQLVEAKENMLHQIEKELKNAPPDVRERAYHELDKTLYGKIPEPEQHKDIDASQAMLVNDRMAKQREQDKGPLEQSDHKTMEQSGDYMYRTRYGQEPPAPEPQIPEAKQIKTLDQSQDYAYRLRFRDEPAAPGDNMGDRTPDLDMDIERD